MKKIVVFFLILLSSLYLQANQIISFDVDTNSTEPIRHLIDGGSSYFEIEYNLPSISISNKSVNGIDYNFIHIKGFGKMGEVGKPALPAHTDIVLFPNDIEPTITILETEFQILDGYYIHPALEPARDTYGAPEPEFEIDNTTYSTDEFYPVNPVEITDIQYFREAPLGFVQIRPIQFNPVTKQLRVYTKIKYRLEFNGSSRIFSEIAENNSNNYTDLLKNYVLNNKNIPDGIAHTASRAGEKNYIIITHSEYLSQANDLAEWKRQLGYSVEVVSQSSWTAAQVKTAIHDLYNSWTPHPDYFVIIGDHTGSYAVPGDVIYTPYSPPDDGPFATDLYFACMDGTGDYVPEMAHGRISVSNTTEATTVIQKIINYEKNPVTDASFYINGLNCAMYQDDDNNGYADRRFCHTSEDIRDYTITQGYSVERIYYTSTTANVTGLRYNNAAYSDGQLLPLELRSVSFDWDGGASDITSAINAGKFYVFHRDHGYVGGSGWASPYYTTTSMNSLTNGDLLPVVFSINCHTGEYQLSNCFAEKLLRMSDKGAVGVVAASYFSLSGYNDGLAEGFIDAIWHEPGLTPDFGSGGVSNPPGSSPTSDIFTMGDVLNQGLIRMVETWNGSSTVNKYEYELFHYFGDPAMKIWTANPNSNVITASHTGSLPVGSTSLSITGCNCSDGLATLVFNDELVGETTLSGGSGTITFPALTNEASTAILTISKHNYKPYTSNITVIDAIPDITVNPLSFSESLGLNATQERTLSITNDGESGSALNYNILISESSGREVTIFPKSNYPTEDIRIDQIKAVPVKYKPVPNNTDATTLCYHDGLAYIVSFINAGVINCAARFTSTELSSYYTNNEITQVRIVVYTSDYTNCTIKVWEGGSSGNPGPIVYSQDITGSVNVGGWTTHTLSSPITLISGNEYWVGYSLTYTGTGNPFGADNGPLVIDKGGWYQYSTGSWNQITTSNLNWCIEMVIDESLAELTLTSPNGSEVWANGESHNITWNHSGAALANVKLELSTNNGTGYSDIVASTSNDGTYEWTVSGTASEQCLVRISDPVVPSTNDVSNAVFRIYDTVTWLTINQDNGSVNQGSTDNLTLTFDSFGLSAGTYNANIVISSNDPDESPFTVPVTLTVNDNSSSGSGNNGGGTGSADVDMPITNIDGSSVDPDVSIDPEGSVGITVNVTVTDQVQGSTPVPFPDNVTISYDIDITGSVTGVNLDFDLEFTGLTGLNQIHWLNGTNWEIPNNVQWNNPSAGHVTFDITLSGRDGSTEIILGQENPLPVTLSSFNAVYYNCVPIINWTTQSESNNSGWNIYRSLSSNTGQSQQINFELIPGAGTVSEPTEYSFIDEYETVINQTYWYWLESISESGETETFGPVSLTIPSEGNDIPEIPIVTELHQNFPNPFNPSTLISFDIKENETGILSIYNIKGQLIVKDEFETGRHNYTWDARDHSSGIYLYKLKTNSYSKIIKMLLVK